jgi:phasin
MLLLLLKNFMWAAWWPYYTMLLAMEKAAAQQAAAARAKSTPQQPQAEAAPRPRPAPPPPQPRSRPDPLQTPFTANLRDEASSVAMSAEVPQALRELMKLNIDQARRGFETFVATSEKAWKSLENASPCGHPGLFELNAKIVEITRLNAEANFALAAKLAEAKDVAQAIELQSQHVKRQMELFVRQLEEMRDLAARMIQDAESAAGTASGAGRANLRAVSGTGGDSSSSYAPTSSYTPGETGRKY